MTMAEEYKDNLMDKIPITENDFSEFKENILKSCLKENKTVFKTIDFSMENFNVLFPRSRVETPLESVKFGRNQFSKFSLRERRNLISAVYETLTKPDIVLEEERLDDFEQSFLSHNYAKNFVMDKDSKMIQSVVVEIEKENVIITSHERPVNEILSKIKQADQILYIAPEIGSLIRQHTQNEQSVSLQFLDKTLQSKTLPLNKSYNHSNLKSIEKLLNEGKLTNKDVLRYGESVGEKTIQKVNHILRKDNKIELPDSFKNISFEELMKCIGDSYGFSEEATNKRRHIAFQTLNRARLVFEKYSEYIKRRELEEQKQEIISKENKSMPHTIQENKNLSEIALNAYRTYQFKWLDQHGGSVFDTLEEMKAEEGTEKIDAFTYDPVKVFDYLADSNGINGEVFVSFNEFKENEFKDKEVVKNLLNDSDYEYYLQTTNLRDPGRILSYEPFGYEGTLCTVDVDIRRGIPSIDIVGLTDSAVKESRENIKDAFRNQQINFPSVRVLIALSPTDVKKETDHSASMAMAILNQMSDKKLKEVCLVLGGIGSAGRIEPVKTHAFAAVERAKQNGITKVVCCQENVKDICNIPEVKIAVANTLPDLDNIIQGRNSFVYRPQTVIQDSVFINGINFNNNNETFLSEDYKAIIENPGYSKSARAIQVAVAGRHNMFLAGSQTERKSDFAETFFRYLTPNLTDEELREVKIIKSLAGERQKPNAESAVTIRNPFQTATIEGMLGGGRSLLPGEISRAHKGILLLDDASVFKQSVIELLRIPLKNKNIILSRAGHQSMFPSDFQLVMTQTDDYEGKDFKEEIKKLTNLLTYVEIQSYLKPDKNDSSVFDMEKARRQIADAYEIQRKRGIFNHDLTVKEVGDYCKLDEKGKDFLADIAGEQNGDNQRKVFNTMKVALTVANLDNRTNVIENDLKEAYALQLPATEKKISVEKKIKNEKQVEYSRER